MNPFEKESFNSDYYKNLFKEDEGLVEDQTQPSVDTEDTSSPQSIIEDPFREDGECIQSSFKPKKMAQGVTEYGIAPHLQSLINTDNAMTSKEVANTFNELFDDLNKTYGLDIRFDFNSFSNTLGYMIKPKNKAAVEVYISESYSRVRATLYIMYLNAIAQLSTQILDPQFITSNSMSYQDKLVLMRELFTYIQSLNDIYKEVNVKDGDIKLRKLQEESQDNNNLDDPGIQEFLESLKNNVKDAGTST